MAQEPNGTSVSLLRKWLKRVSVKVGRSSSRKKNFHFSETHPDHLHTPALCRPHVVATDLCNTYHSALLLSQNMPCNTIGPRHHRTCAKDQHEYRKNEPLPCLNLGPPICAAARASKLLMAMLAQFLQQLQHSTELQCCNGAVCSSQCGWRE